MRTLTACLALTFVLTACGFKAGLYLPKDEGKAPATSQPAPQAASAAR